MFISKVPVNFVSCGLFSFGGEWIHPDRILNDNEIIVMVEGIAKICVGEERFTLKSGDVLIIPKDKRHYGFEKSFGKTSFYWGHFTADNECVKAGLFSDINISSLIILFNQLIHTAYMGGYRTETKDYYITLILLELEHLTDTNSRQNKLCEEIKDYIRIYYATVSVQEISAKMGYNTDYLSRIFKKSTGSTIQNFIIKIKIEKGKEMLLTTHMAIGEVGTFLGYEDLKTFGKVFKKNVNMTPSEFRHTFSAKHTNIK